MSKILIFSLLWWLTGNPFLAVIVLLIILYVLDRRFVGISPSVVKPFKLRSKLSRLRQELSLNRHNRSVKLEAARVAMELNKYALAKKWLEEIADVEDDSADVYSELGLCCLKLGELKEGERLILKALDINPRVKFGEPYLRLGEALAETDSAQAIAYLERFKEQHSSSCEAYYRLGKLYKRLGRTEKAKEAFEQTIEIYRGLPKYKKRTERRYALLARFQ
ncbi:tetratricopeptide repeat protein [Paenibacillus thalictri]|uniref:Tetratricopeptide repeat protein n=1 Tax=Paenibacillus thalictri TaxID=2527873 RepID=A0A4Q9DVU7_9BACL|nr:tetratricopeptide repeat protein [Paenibacillus thalictri]TBL81149.1 tetratricopeptide repeat protein [Paenibacillus thalictri]